jgi:subtilisin family serine protease
MITSKDSLQPVMASLPDAVKNANEHQGTPYIPGEVIVLLSADIDRNGSIEACENLDGVEAALQGAVVRRVSLARGRSVLRIKLPAGKSVEDALKDNWRKRDRRILIVEPNYRVHILAMPDDPCFAEMWALHNTGQTGGTPDADIDAPEAWDLNIGSTDVVVAVIDSGIDYLHPDLVDNMWINPGEVADNGIDDDGNGYIDDVHGYDFYAKDPDPSDPQGHGTHCAGIIAARGNNGTGGTGVNWTCKLMACRFLNIFGSGSTYGAIEAINYAVDNGADILSNSWGGYGYSAALEAVIQDANDHGVLFVAAAGNDGSDIDTANHFPSDANVPNVIAVAATDSNDALASFSNYGRQSVDLGAPGVAVLSTIPNFQTLFFEDFQGANTPAFKGTQMSTEGPANLWGTIESDIEAGNITARGDWQNSYPYLGDSDGAIVTPPMDTRGLRGLIVEFRYRYEINPTDALTMDVWDGTTWHNLFLLNKLVGLKDDYDGERIEIPEAYRDEQMKIRFRWITDANDNLYYGVEIDDIRILCIEDGTGAYSIKDGTSMATPHVAGAAALLLANNPSISLQELKSRLVWAGDPIPALDDKTLSGRRLNAYNALTISPQLTLQTPNGGEVWRFEMKYPIRWISIGGSSSADIYLIKGQDIYTQLADDIPNDGMFLWFIPDNIHTGSDYRIRIDDGVRMDISDSNFSIIQGTVSYVDANAPGKNDGTSWKDAYNYLQDALENARLNSDIGQIRVAKGIYRPDTCSAEPNQIGNRQASFKLINGVVIKGGYAGFGRPDPNARDFYTYETFLSGDLDGNDIDVNDPYDLLTEPTRNENSFHVVSSSLINETGVLDGFTITAGNANGTGDSFSGGGIFIQEGSPIIINCTLRANSARGYGGAIDNNSGKLTLTNCSITGNCARNGGGLTWCFGSITNCSITGNCADTGGGLSWCFSSITNCFITGNTAVKGGGFSSCFSSVTNCTIAANAADYGGGFYSCSGPITNCTITNNKANRDGGGFYKNEGLIANCTITGNKAMWGGGLCECDGPVSKCIISGNTARYSGAGLAYCSGPITNCTITGNKAIQGGGFIFCDGQIANCIIWENRPLENQIKFSTVPVYSCIQGYTEGLANINVDPCFVESGYWDANGTPADKTDDFWIHGDYHLKSEGWRWDSQRQVWTWDNVTSRCLDAGNPGSPISDELITIPEDPDNIWGQNIRINMGAYGGTARASIPPYNWVMLADLNNDGIVDFVDLRHWTQYWLTKDSEQPGDLNRNEVVDFLDLAILTKQWLIETSWHMP